MAALKVALITGGGSGIGAASARQLAQTGVHVVVAGRTQAKLQSLVADLRAQGQAAEALVLDVTDRKSLAPRLAELQMRVGPIDGLVTSAGIAPSASLRKSEEQEELCTRTLEVNFHGARRVMEALLPSMIEQKYGRIVHIASSAALYGYPYVSAYCASKHALLGYARAAAKELAPLGVAVQVLCPWYVETPMTEASIERIVKKTGRSAGEARALLAAQNPGGRLLSVEEVADATLRLLQCERGGLVLELDGPKERQIDAGIALGST